jgi:predicted nuclease of restriction endonuclease-like RecB superfamily
MILQAKKGIPSLRSYYTNKSGNKYYYQSACELAIMLLLDKANKNWEKNTKLKIEYELDGQKHFYIPDFIIKENKQCTILEIKGHQCKDLDAKMEALKKYCDDNKYLFSLIDYVAIKSLIDWQEVKNTHALNILKQSVNNEVK